MTETNYDNVMVHTVKLYTVLHTDFNGNSQKAADHFDSEALTVRIFEAAKKQGLNAYNYLKESNKLHLLEE